MPLHTLDILPQDAPRQLASGRIVAAATKPAMYAPPRCGYENSYFFKSSGVSVSRPSISYTFTTAWSTI